MQYSPENFEGPDKTTVLFFKYMLKQNFPPICFNQYISNMKSLFGDSLRTKQATLSMGKISFSLTNFYLAIVLGNVQGPLRDSTVVRIARSAPYTDPEL